MTLRLSALWGLWRFAPVPHAGDAGTQVVEEWFERHGLAGRDLGLAAF
jgi:hypothetical protein